MYCRICGTLQTGTINYCSHDGAMMDDGLQQAMLQKEDSAYCRSCGGQNQSSDSYCYTCGDSLLKVAKASARIERSEGQPAPVSVAAKSMLGVGAIGGVIASFAMLLAGLIGSFVVSNQLKETLLGVFGMSQELFDVQTLVKFFGGMTQTILNYHLLSIGVSGGEEQAAHLSVSIPFLLFLFIPLLILVGTGIWMQGRYEMMAMRERFVASCITGIMYGFFLLIISLFADRTFVVESFFYGGENGFTFAYSSGMSFVSGFLYGTLFSFIGMMMYAGRSNILLYMDESIPFGASLYSGAASVVKGLIVTTIVIFILTLFSKPGSVGPLQTKSEKTLLAAQFAPYMWGMAHFAPLQIGSSILDEEFYGEEYNIRDATLQVSYWGGTSIAGMSLSELARADGADEIIAKKLDDVSKSLRWGLLLTLIPVLFLFYAGWRLAKIRPRNMYITLGVFSASYAITAVVINKLANISIEANAMELLSVQNHSGYLFVFSLIMAYGAAFVGMKLAKQ